ncbi:MAG: hypothetical protein CM15mP21_4320 [Hyphomicrobiales bacterium]|nr:MAG: hypothetical protein CM15mP21_4320 [Hyphomicrobiales bacterium]
MTKPNLSGRGEGKKTKKSSPPKAAGQSQKWARADREIREMR